MAWQKRPEPWAEEARYTRSREGHDGRRAALPTRVFSIKTQTVNGKPVRKTTMTLDYGKGGKSPFRDKPKKVNKSSR